MNCAYRNHQGPGQVPPKCPPLPGNTCAACANPFEPNERERRAKAPDTLADNQEAGRDVQPDYMTPWEWIADIGKIAAAAAVAVTIMGIGMGFIYGRWVL